MFNPARQIRSLVAAVGLCLVALPSVATAARVATCNSPVVGAGYEVSLLSVDDTGECGDEAEFSQLVRTCEVQTEVGRRSVRCSTLQLGEVGSKASFSLVGNAQSFFEVATSSSFSEGEVFRGDSASALFSVASNVVSDGEPLIFAQTIDAGSQCERTYTFSVTAR